MDSQDNVGPFRGERWHVGKEIPIMGIIAFIGLIASNLFIYATFTQEVRSYMKANDDKFAHHVIEQARTFKGMKEYVDSRTADRIHSTTVYEKFATVDEKFNVRDMQINNIASDVVDIKEGVATLGALLNTMKFERNVQ